MNRTEERYAAMKRYLEAHGITKDTNKVVEALEKLKKYQYDAMYGDGYYMNFLIIFRVKVKLIMDDLFRDSYDYMSEAKCLGPNGEALLDICDIVNIYRPYSGSTVRGMEADSI